MTHPDNQPGGSHPGGGGPPPAPGYQQGYGGMPQAPQEYGGGPVARPGNTTATAVLAFVQAGVTLITTGILMIGLAAIENVADDLETSAGGVDIGAGLAEAWIVSIVQLVGVGLLVYAGVKVLSGTAGPLLVIATGLQLVLCVYWLIRGADPIVPVLLAVMPIVALILSFGAANKDYVRFRTTGRT
ncbi:hypothetical protein [Actinophytocola sp.]|uniref:hypothetical protein n=1 Tax=Actinophytocola sp. TaxID=1872138 RepID=UPI003D6A594B